MEKRASAPKHLDTFTAQSAPTAPKQAIRAGDATRFRARQARTNAAVRELPGLRNFGPSWR